MCVRVFPRCFMNIRGPIAPLLRGLARQDRQRVMRARMPRISLKNGFVLRARGLYASGKTARRRQIVAIVRIAGIARHRLRERGDRTLVVAQPRQRQPSRQ